MAGTSGSSAEGAPPGDASDTSSADNAKTTKWRMDLLLIFGMVLIACLFLVIRHVSRESAIKNEKSDSLVVTAEVNGKVWGSWSLDENHVIEIDTDYGHNELTIRDGAAYMTDADCPDKYCMQMGKAMRTGDNIVCLPHKLVIGIASPPASDAGGSSDLGIDTVAR